jgi:hypothetical protein
VQITFSLSSKDSNHQAAGQSSVRLSSSDTNATALMT